MTSFLCVYKPNEPTLVLFYHGNNVDRNMVYIAPACWLILSASCCWLNARLLTKLGSVVDDEQKHVDLDGDYLDPVLA